MSLSRPSLTAVCGRDCCRAPVGQRQRDSRTSCPPEHPGGQTNLAATELRSL